jgi:tryptophan-rich sensory protein
MDVSTTTARRVSRIAWGMAAFATVAGQLHALARINSHPGDLEEGLTKVWAVPAMDAVRPLLDWGDPYFVYWTYGKIWLPIFLTMLVSAWIVYRRREPMGAERLAWRILLGAYAVATVSVAGDYYTPWTEIFFAIGLVPMLAIGLVGPWLGILMLRHGFRPRVTPWALILFIPGFIVITSFTSMGSVILPSLWAWAYALHVSVRGDSMEERAPVPAAGAMVTPSV